MLFSFYRRTAKDSRWQIPKGAPPHTYFIDARSLAHPPTLPSYRSVECSHTLSSAGHNLAGKALSHPGIELLEVTFRTTPFEATQPGSCSSLEHLDISSFPRHPPFSESQPPRLLYARALISGKRPV
ncbi:hypothetical protein VTH06DRAFT_8422 [Thermothelomyces fergusii]